MGREFVVWCVIVLFQPCIHGWCGVGRLLGVYSTEAHCRTRMLSTVSRIRMQVGHSSEPPRASCDLPTRSVALSVGFVGSNFHGYQADPTLPTIEQALRDACKAINVAPFNRKIKPEHRWTASSRTDARVHASRIVVAAPLCISELDARETSRLTQALNENLPPDIRVHSALVLPPPLAALDARAHCSHREYSYTIPLSAIASITPHQQLSPAAVLARTQAACSAFVGARDFHNFCSPVRVPQLRAYARSCWNSLPFTRDTLREGCPVQVVQYNTTTSGASICLSAYLGVCPHASITVSAYFYICVLMSCNTTPLPQVPRYICPHTSMCALIPLYMSPQTSINVSSNPFTCGIRVMYLRCCGIRVMAVSSVNICTVVLVKQVNSLNVPQLLWNSWQALMH